jgi:hypothetical protein
MVKKEIEVFYQRIFAIKRLPEQNVAKYLTRSLDCASVRGGGYTVMGANVGN